MPTALKRILCVDDDDDTCAMLEIFLTHAGYKTVSANDINECLSLIKKEKFDLFLLDLWLKDAQEFELCRRIRETDATTPIIIYSADARRETQEKLKDVNVQAFLIKPKGLDELLQTIEDLLNKR
jgi:DNA-binding response OmpR family regulator